MMSNVFLTPDIIAREALIVLENNLVMANLVHRDYSDEFVSVGDTAVLTTSITMSLPTLSDGKSRMHASFSLSINF